MEDTKQVTHVNTCTLTGDKAAVKPMPTKQRTGINGSNGGGVDSTDTDNGKV